MRKYVVTATTDEFFFPDEPTVWWDDMPEPKHLLWVLWQWIQSSYSELNSTESTEFVENYFLVVLKMKITKNNLLQIP